MKSTQFLYLVIGILSANSACEAKQDAPETFKITLGDYSHVYNVVTPKGNGNVKIVYVPDFSDNYTMGDAATKALIQKMPQDLITQIEAVVMPGDKANMMGTLLYQGIAHKRTQSDSGSTEFVILRSAEKGQIENSVTYDSITGGNKTLNIREDQGKRIKGKKILLFDDVVSSGGTLKAAKDLAEKYGCEVLAVACIGTEGTPRDTFEGKPLFYLTHVPVWTK